MLRQKLPLSRLFIPLTIAFAAIVLGMGSEQPATPAMPPAASSSLLVKGIEVTEVTMSLADLKALPRRTLTVQDKDGAPLTYSGPSVEDVLTKAGMAFGRTLRGPKLRNYLLVEASDGYGVVFALPELSSEFSDRLVIIADTVGDKPLAASEGPLKVIVSDEKKHARWVRNVTSLTVCTSTPEQKK